MTEFNTDHQADIVDLSERLVEIRRRQSAGTFAAALHDAGSDTRAHVRLEALALTADRLWTDNLELRRRADELSGDADVLRRRVADLLELQALITGQLDKAVSTLRMAERGSGHPALWAGLVLGFTAGTVFGLLALTLI